MAPQDWGVMTRNSNRAYVHILDPEAPRQLQLPGAAGLSAVSARVFGSDEPVALSSTQGDLVLTLPEVDPEKWDWIVVLELG